MDDNYSEEIRENSLFHYTNAKGLIGILKEKTIWASSYHTTNDLAEFKVGGDLLAKEISSLVEPARNSNAVKEKIYKEILDETINALSKINVFITSFCIAQDRKIFTDGLLSQWRGYGKEGYAIVFNRNRLIRILKEASINGDLGSVCYEGQKNRFMDDLINHYANEVLIKLVKTYDKNCKTMHVPVHIHAEMMKKFRALHKSFTKKIISFDSKGRINDEYRSLLSLITLTKSKDFEQEMEHRLCFYVTDEAIKNKVRLFERNGLTVPYVSPDKDFLECVEKIIIGPSSRMDDKEKSLKILLKSINKQKIKVYQSKISFSRI